MPPRRSTRNRAKTTTKKSAQIPERQAVQFAEEEIKEEEVKIKQEEITENDDDLEQSREQLEGDNDQKLDDKSWVAAFEKWELDGVLEENLNFISNEGAYQNSVEKETAGAADEVVKSPDHMDDISRVQEAGDNEGNSADGLEDVEDTADNNVLKSPVHMHNCSRVQEGGDEEGKSANDVEDDEYNEDSNVIQSPGYKNDFYGVQEGGDGEAKSADAREGTDNVKDDECRKGTNDMKSPGHLDDFSGVQDSGDEVGKRVDNVEDDEDNNVIKSPALMDDFDGVQEGSDEEGKSACERESVDGVKDNKGNEVNNVMKSTGHADEFIGVQDDGDEELKSADDKEDGDGEDNRVMESLGLLNDFSRVQEGGNEEGKSACQRESIDGVKDNDDKEVNNVMKSPGHLGEFIGVQNDDDEELKSADDMEDNGDGADNKVIESLGHLDNCTEVQEGCDEEGDSADDVEDNEGCDDSEEVEHPPLTKPGKLKQPEIHVTTVYVKGLVKSWNVEKLKELCKQYGKILNVRLPQNFGAKHKDFGFIVFTSHKSARACVEGINNAQLGGETKVKADLAKPRFRGEMQKKKRWGKHHANNEEVETEMKGQTHGDKSKGTGNRGRGIAKEESQAPSLLNRTKVGKPKNQRTSFSEGQDANPVKTDGKIKNLPQKTNDRGKRKIDHDLNKRQSKKSRGIAQGRQSNRNSVRKPHRKEGNSLISGSKWQHSDMEPHAGYIEPAMKKPARHYARYAEAAYGHQGHSPASYLQHVFQNQRQPSPRYVEPGLGRQALTHAGYIEPAVEKQGYVAYDYSLRSRAGGYTGQGSQGSAYVRGSAVPPTYAQNHTSHIVYQGVASVSSYNGSGGTYLPPQQYY
ncbi:unnamed protein product [Dovyalis caffra]|uniref:RRM domain-containing protein n=1 Tax=Dovyalis caffra TaxID=77055 RepID=A0AAV1RKW8_9ROSI|nr:unnamed protein product [Dovyalis caffra]